MSDKLCMGVPYNDSLLCDISTYLGLSYQMEWVVYDYLRVFEGDPVPTKKTFSLVPSYSWVATDNSLNTTASTSTLLPLTITESLLYRHSWSRSFEQEHFKTSAIYHPLLSPYLLTPIILHLFGVLCVFYIYLFRLSQLSNLTWCVLLFVQVMASLIILY